MEQDKPTDHTQFKTKNRKLRLYQAKDKKNAFFQFSTLINPQESEKYEETKTYIHDHSLAFQQKSKGKIMITSFALTPDAQNLMFNALYKCMRDDGMTAKAVHSMIDNMEVCYNQNKE